MGIRQARLTEAVTQAKSQTVDAAATDWSDGSDRLAKVASRLRQAAQLAADGIDGDTGPAMAARFTEAVDLLNERSRQMRAGADALRQTKSAIDIAVDEHAKIATSEITPQSYRQPDGWSDMTEMQKKADRDAHDRGQASAMADEEAKREEQARIVTESFERRYETPIETMKNIYGYQEPPPPPTGGGGSGGSSSGGSYTPPTGGSTGVPTLHGSGGTIGHYPQTDHDGSSQTDTPTDPDSTGGDSHDPSLLTGSSTQSVPTTPTSGANGEAIPPVSTSGPGGGVSPGVLGGVVGGIAGGAALGAIARNGGMSGLLGKGSLSSRGVAPIGGSSKGSSGVLGRSGAGTGAAGRGAGSAGRGAGGAGGAGRGAGAAGRGAAASGRGAGGRGAGAGRGGAAGAGGRGGTSKDQKKGSDQDRFDDGQDWLDDDGVGPAVLD
ncbi:hypothetical protein GCM10027020_33930 [Nocardioides salsibiostraticola]